MTDLSSVRAGDVLSALRALDGLLARAVSEAATLYGPEAAGDPYRGLVVSTDEVTQLLERDPAQPLFGASGSVIADIADAADAEAFDDEALDAETFDDAGVGEGGRLAWLADAFGLSPFDVDVLLVAIAPELDLRYERIYGYLHDDVTRRRPSIDLVLNLLCASSTDRIEARARFAPDAPLVRHRLVEILDDPHEPAQPLLKRTVRVDEQIVNFVLAESTLDRRLAGCAGIECCDHADPAPHGEPALGPLAHLAFPAPPSTAPPRLYLQGALDAGHRRAAGALAARIERPLLVVDLELARRGETPITVVIRTAFREAWLRRLGILLDGVDVLRGDAAAVDVLTAETASSRVPTMLAGRGPWPPAGHRLPGATGVVVVPLPPPTAETRRAWWRQELDAAQVRLDDRDLDAVADRYRLGRASIAEAVRSAHDHACWSGGQVRAADLVATARRQSGHDLAGLAQKVEHVLDWDDLILPEDAQTQLHELRAWVAHRQRVLSEWGFERSLPLGKGICALFAGPSGTGKSMAAGVVAADLGLDLYRIDLATVVSKYIGETEKNLERIFTAAENANAVLFFDEADAIFGKRSAVHDAHDRYANIEIAYLLQRMEQYDGITILATNVREHVDDAFLRRLQFIIEFPVPDQDQRERMWREFLPAEAPVDAGVDFPFLAERFRLTGGNIKNAVVSAAYLASANGGRINMGHLVRATWREHQKIGRILSRGDLGEYASMLPRRDSMAAGGVV